MRDFEIKDITEHCYRGGTVSTLRDTLWGEFPAEETEKSGLKTFRFVFRHDPDKEDEGLPTIDNYELLELSVKEFGGEYIITLECSGFDGERTDRKILYYSCEKINVILCRYKGFSYKNVYSGREPFINEREQWYKPEYLLSAEERDIGEGISVVMELYGEEPTIPDRNFGSYIAVGKYLKEGKVICESYTLPQHRMSFFDPIHHSNGHLYYHYSAGLYGAAFMEIDTGKRYVYVPEGYEHDYLSECGESFIVISVHYDIDSDLLACNGCYWAGSDEVFVMDFSDPLNFDPHMVRIEDEVFSDEDEYDDFFFARWEKDCLILKDYDGKEHSVTKARLREMLKEKRKG